MRKALESVHLTACETIPGDQSVLTVAEGESLPFAVRRLYWIDFRSAGVWRGGHAHTRLRQCFFVPRGAIRLVMRDGLGGALDVTLHASSGALVIPAGLWRDYCALEDGAMLLVAASEAFSEEDYIRDWAQFVNSVKEPGSFAESNVS